MSGKHSTDQARQQILQAIATLDGSGVLSRSGHANLSVRLGDGRILLTAKGFVRSLGVEDMAVVDLEGHVVEGDLDQTNAEIVEMHTDLYGARPDVGAIIHTHSPKLLAFALANKALPSRYEALLRMGQAEDVPVVPWAPRGTKESVGGVIRAAIANPTTKAVLLGNHGVLAFHEDISATVNLVSALEEAADGELAAGPIGGAKSLPRDALMQVREAIAAAER